MSTRDLGDLDPNAFARVPLGAIKLAATGRIKVAHLGVLASLASFAGNETGVCFPALDSLAERCGYKSVNALTDPLKALEGAGAIGRRLRWKRPKDGPDGPKSYQQTDEFSVPTSTEYAITGFPRGRQYPKDSEGSNPKNSGGTYPNDSGGKNPNDSGGELDPPELDPEELPPQSRIDVLRAQDDWTDAEYRELRAAGLVCHNWKHWAEPPRVKHQDHVPPLPDWVTCDLRRAAKAKNISDAGWLWTKVREMEQPHIRNRVAVLRKAIEDAPVRKPRTHWEEV